MEIEKLFAQLHTLPSIPKVAQDLIGQFDNPSSSLEAIARNIEKDPVISAKILRLANSARFKGARESTSIEDAAMRLGFNTMRTLVLASAVTGAFTAPASFNLKGFWLKSFQVASIARVLAKQTGQDPEVAFTTGLMHNIGELLIQTGAPELVDSLNARRSSSPPTRPMKPCTWASVIRKSAPSWRAAGTCPSRSRMASPTRPSRTRRRAIPPALADRPGR